MKIETNSDDSNTLLSLALIVAALLTLGGIGNLIRHSNDADIRMEHACLRVRGEMDGGHCKVPR